MIDALIRSTFGLLLILGLVFTIAPSVRAQDDEAPSKAETLQDIFLGAVPASIEQLKEMETHIQELVKKVTPATVGVRVGAAQGSGVIISKDGFVLTAAHVNGKANENVTFIFPDGSTKKGKTLGLNRGVDSGMMKITDEGEYPFIEMGKSEELRRGQWVLATGHPNGYQRGRPPVVRIGRILSNRSTVITTDCTLVGGDSGGPLFDMDGKVIGIHSRIGGSLTANMHVPVDTYNDSWDRLVAAETWGGGNSGPYIGVQGDPEATNAKIVEVVPGGSADKAGIQAGDIITKFDGKATPDFATLGQLVRAKKPDDKVQVEVEREGETIVLELKVGQR